LNPGNNQTLSVTFTPTDTTDYATVTQTVPINVNLATPNVTVSDAGGVYNGSAFPATETVAGVDNNPGSSLEGVAPTFTYYASGAPLAAAPSQAGTYTVVATFAGSTDYTSADSPPTIFTIFPANLTIAGVTGTNKIYDALTGDTIGGTAALQGVIIGDTVNLDASGATASFADKNVGIARTVTFSAYAISGSQAGNYTLSQPTDSLADIAAALPIITWSNPADITYGTALGSAQLNATADVDGTFAYSPAPGTVLNAGSTQTLSVTFTPTDTTNYKTITQTVAINVNPATPSVTVSDAGGIYNGSAFAATATVAGVNNNAGASLENVTLTLTYYTGSDTTGTPFNDAPIAPGTYTVVAFFPGSTNYASAYSPTASFTIAPPVPVFDLNYDRVKGTNGAGSIVTLTGAVTDIGGFQDANALQVIISTSFSGGSNYTVNKTLSQDGKTISIKITAVLSDAESTQDGVSLTATDVFGSSAGVGYIF
jgi:hypothetical protein